jgi:hypothetical protein
MHRGFPRDGFAQAAHSNWSENSYLQKFGNGFQHFFPQTLQQALFSALN